MDTYKEVIDELSDGIYKPMIEDCVNNNLENTTKKMR